MIFEVDAGFLDNETLSAQMRHLMLLATADGETQRTSLPACWLGHETALAVRVNQLIAEMKLRAKAVPESLPQGEESIIWPAFSTTSLEEQLDFIRARRDAGQLGRIRPPRNDHELWACYKYSVLARNHQAYQRLGQRVAARAVSMEVLWRELIHACQVTPMRGSVRNALQHMWGYISNHSKLNPQTDDLKGLLREVQVQAGTHNSTYLLNSTALGELALWV